VKHASCDQAWQIDALREGRLGAKDAESFERHRRSCTACREQMERDERLRALVRALADDGPGELTLRRLRQRILRDVATDEGTRPAPVRSRLVAGVLVAAACVAGWVLLSHRGAAPGSLAASTAVATTAQAPVAAPEALAGGVVASSDARWTQVRDGKVERVHLDEGSVRVHVRPQRVGERFLVEMPDGEIEVRGTTFEVTVAAGETARVHVDEGRVELRLHGRDVAQLGAGETWTPPAVAPAQPPAASAPAPHASAAADDAGAAYAGAIELLRAGRNEQAAAAFRAFLVAHPRAPQSEDASFLQAVALARAGRADAAALAAQDHLARFPSSFHRKDAAVLVARAASRRGDCAEARAILAPWLGQAPDPTAVAALGACAADAAP